MSDRTMHTVPPPPAASSSHGEDFAEVVVVRHGETAGNALRIIQGHMDIELNETGKQQAVMVARRLANEAKPAAVYSSDLKRAADTAQTIATACNVSYLVLNPALRERHMGDLHGLKFDDAVRSKPDAYKAFTSEDRSQEIPGGGESLDQLSDRCVSYLNTIASKHKGERVIVVTHGASIEELCRHADPTSSVPRRIPNTSICVFHISGTTGHWILERFGDVAHLMEVSFPKTAFGGDGASA
ncbi:phosphoglycerate mutase-like protein 4 [Oryza brachyantha]|uniref:phosphoglycerate mutase-like protein 4 n=1 Tax=Oryza brachyantha TaxID=4533 RepID=UPI001AD9A5A8|nr:phosphoglycerate mutase-like protein 4 [Oryza brachyantha]